MKIIIFLILSTAGFSCFAQTNEYKVTNTYHIKSAGGWDYIAVNDYKIYVSHGNQVNILSVKNGDSLGIIPNTNGVHGIAFDNETGKGFTSNGRTNSVTVFDLKTNKTLQVIPTNGKDPDAIMLEPYTKTIITCNGESNNLSVIDPMKNKVIKIINLGGAPEKAVFNGEGKVFVNIEDKNEIAVVNLKTYTVQNRWSLDGGEGPTGLEYDAETKRLFAACEKQLIILDATSGKVIDKLPIGEGCDGVAFDKKNKIIFTSNGEGSITVIKEENANRFTVSGNYPTKKGARTIAIDETTGTLYLPTADFEPNTPAGTWPKMIPGTFGIMEVKATPDQQEGKKVMLMNRIGPSVSTLYVANADGTNEHALFDKSGFDYHASFSADGNWIVFTSERNGLGQADIYRVHPDGTGLEQLTNDPALDDQASLSPDGSQLAFVSSRINHTANIWILNLTTHKLMNLTGQPNIKADTLKPNGFFRPAWSPDGKWLAFASDRNTEWKGHSNGAGWEHIQELRIYVVNPDGTGLRKISRDSVCSGSPKWSPDGKRIIFYEMSVEDTWNARTSFGAARATSQIVSVDVNTGARTVHTTGPGLKLLPQYVTPDNIGFLAKAGENEGIGYTNGKAIKRKLRSPSWSTDGSKVVYEKQDWTPRKQNQLLYSWDSDYEYRYTDVFPSFSKDGKLLVTEKDDNSSVGSMDADGSNKQRIFEAGDGEAFFPNWSPDGQWVVFGYGGYFQSRTTRAAKIMMVKRDSTGLRNLTNGEPNAGFPCFSPDGKKIVYRVFGKDDHGLRIMNMEDSSITVLTNEYDNLPDWSPDGTKIMFTRKHDNNNFDIFTITPDGKELKQLTTYPTNDAHAVWTNNGKQILWNSGEYGFKEEAALSDNTFQPYGTIWIMNADGTNKRPLTDSPWEDSMPCYVPANN